MTHATQQPGRTGPAAPAVEPASREEAIRAIDALVEECRVEALWSFRADFRPRNDRERRQVLEAIQERSGRDVFRRAGVLRAWLSRHSSDESAGC